MATLNDIEIKTKTYADRRAQLADAVRELNDAIEAMKRRHLATIKKRVAAAAEAHAELKADIEASPQLFEKPRSVIIAGIKVGYQKGKGKIEWEDDAQVVKLIRRHFPEQFDVLVNTVETPVKKALAQLSVQDLKKLAVDVEDTGDVVLIKPADSRVDKLVSALLKDATEDAQ